MHDRYTLALMKQLWSEESKFEYWLKVELAVLKARVGLGEIPAAAYEAISEHADFNVPRIKEIEAEVAHDMIAFVKCVQEHLVATGAGEHKELFHEQVTSYDVEDPAFILMLRDAVNLILPEIRTLESALRERAREHKWTLMVARTHGQYAEPTTFGKELMVYAEAMRRSAERLEHVREHELSEGKISGAVGTYGGTSPKLEEVALRILGLRPARAETQILQRDRHAMLMAALAVVAASVEQMTRTFWEMMRAEVRELQEPRSAKQRGSSRMAHKKNPILTERGQGLPRLLRGYLIPAIENIATPEGRDISQSSVERIIFPDATGLVHFMANKAAALVRGLEVFPERMRYLLEEDSLGVWASAEVRTRLMGAGISYDDAYLYTQQAAFLAVKERRHYREVLKAQAIGGDQRTAEAMIGAEELEKCFDARAVVEEGVTRIFEQAV